MDRKEMPSAMPADRAESLSDAGPWVTPVRRFQLPNGEIIEPSWISDFMLGDGRRTFPRSTTEEIFT